MTNRVVPIIGDEYRPVTAYRQGRWPGEARRITDPIRIALEVWNSNDVSQTANGCDDPIRADRRDLANGVVPCI